MKTQYCILAQDLFSGLVYVDAMQSKCVSFARHEGADEMWVKFEDGTECYLDREQSIFVRPPDGWVVDQMESKGGSFVERLAHAFLCADSENQSKIISTWGEYWQNYSDFAMREHCNAHGVKSPV